MEIGMRPEAVMTIHLIDRRYEVGAFYWTVLAPDTVNPGREEWVSIQL